MAQLPAVGPSSGRGRGGPRHEWIGEGNAVLDELVVAGRNADMWFAGVLLHARESARSRRQLSEIDQKWRMRENSSPQIGR